MKLSIIIVNYNFPYLIEKCIQTIISSRIPFKYEIIIIDNASKDLPSIPQSKYPTIQVIKNKENVGFGRANNQGVKIAKGEYLLFLNTDIEVVGDAIEKMVLFAETQEKNTIFGGKLLNPDKSPQPSCGPFYTLPITFLMLFLKGDQLGITRYSPDEVKKVDWVSGACLLLRKDSFTHIGGFDEAIFMYMDEVDMCYRAKQKGMEVVFCPTARFIHLGAATSKTVASPIQNIYRGLLYYYKKHANFVQYTIVAVMLLLKAYIAIVIGVVTQNRDLTTTYKKAASYL